MNFILDSVFGPGAGAGTAPRRTTPASHFRPGLETLEDRTVLSAAFAPLAAPAPVLLPAAQGIAAALPPANAHSPVGQLARQISNLATSGLQIINFAVNQAGQLVANATILGQHVVLPVSGITLTPPAAGATCPVLHLELGPLDLNLLGLRVQLSHVCLDVTATQGGGLLGDLLCGLTNPPVAGGLLEGLLGLLNNPQVLGLLNNALGQLLATGTPTAPGAAPACTGIQPNPAGSCPILHLNLAPVNLSLLGLNVNLSGCDDCPIILDVTAIPTPLPGGGLLGNPLCSLSHLLDHRGALV